MNQSRANRSPIGGLPRALHRYLVAVAVTGPLLAASVVLVEPPTLAADDLPPLATLAAMALLAVLLPLRIREQTLVNVVGAAYLALILVSPVALPGLIGVAVALAGRVIRRRNDALEVLFNVGQTALYVTSGAVFFRLTSALP